MMVALPAVLALWNRKTPPGSLVMVALPALMLLWKCVRPAFEMLVMPLVSALMRLNVPRTPTATVPRIAPVVPPSPSCSVPPLMVVPPDRC